MEYSVLQYDLHIGEIHNFAQMLASKVRHNFQFRIPTGCCHCRSGVEPLLSSVTGSALLNPAVTNTQSITMSLDECAWDELSRTDGRLVRMDVNGGRLTMDDWKYIWPLTVMSFQVRNLASLALSNVACSSNWHLLGDGHSHPRCLYARYQWTLPSMGVAGSKHRQNTLGRLVHNLMQGGSYPLCMWSPIFPTLLRLCPALDTP
jgi:hypothetical protein